jgi:RecA/RadA recombinase
VINLIVINNLTKFFRDSRAEHRLETASTVKEVISLINRACGKNNVAIIATCDSNLSSKCVIPRPIGGTYLKHIANVIVYLKNISTSTFLPSFKATLVKHQYLKTPKSVIVHGRKCGRMMLLN